MEAIQEPKGTSDPTNRRKNEWMSPEIDKLADGNFKYTLNFLSRRI